MPSEIYEILVKCGYQGTEQEMYCTFAQEGISSTVTGKWDWAYNILSSSTIEGTVLTSNGPNEAPSWKPIPQQDIALHLFANIILVDPNGNDMEGMKGNLNRPFKTIYAAVTAAEIGDTIVVMPGNYLEENNLAKDGVSYYFYQGAIVTKKTYGVMFNCNGFQHNVNIAGHGSFYKTNEWGTVFYNTSEIVVNLSFNEISSTSYIAINVLNGHINIKGCSCLCSGNFAINANNLLSLNIDVSYIKSTASYGLYMVNIRNVLVNSTSIISTTTNGVFSYITSSSYNNTFNIDYTNGYEIYVTGQVVINGNAEYVYANSFNSGINYCKINYNGFIDNLIVQNNATFKGGMCNKISVISGYANTTFVSSDKLYSSVSVSGGTCVLTCTDIHNYGNFLVDGNGRLEILNSFNLNPQWFTPHPAFEIKSGTTILYGTMTINSDMRYHPRDLTLAGGTLIVKGGIKINSGLSSFYKSGGNLILDGATITRVNPVSPFICCPTPQNIMVYAGGVSINGNSGDLLSAKKQKNKLIVTDAETTTSIRLSNLFSEWETFTYTAIGGETQAMIASEMVNLINQSPTLGIAAYQDEVGTDDYFYIEADNAGSGYTIGNIINLTSTQIRINSAAITNISGGPILEYSGITN